MAQRTKQKTARRKAVPKKIVTTSPQAEFTRNREAQWSVYKNLQQKMDQAWAKLRFDLEKKAPISILIEDRNHLLLLLGECSYLAGECIRMSERD
jgi:hypothetical protein